MNHLNDVSEQIKILESVINDFVVDLENHDIEIKDFSDLKTLIEIYQLLTNFEKQDSNIQKRT